MACTLTAGRALDCKDAVGGILRIGLATWDTTKTLTIVGDEVTEIAGTFNVYKFELVRNTGSLVDTVVSNVQNATIYYEQTLVAILSKLSAAALTEVRKINQGRWIIFIEDANQNIFMMGHGKGAEVTSGSVNETGTATGDFNGYRFEFKSEERLSCYHVDYDTDFDTSIEALGTITVI